MSQLSKRRKKKICRLWEEFQEAEPEISTKRLLWMVAEECDCDEGDVVDVMAEMGF